MTKLFGFNTKEERDTYIVEQARKRMNIDIARELGMSAEIVSKICNARGIRKGKNVKNGCQLHPDRNSEWYKFYKENYGRITLMVMADNLNANFCAFSSVIYRMNNKCSKR